MNHKAPYTYFFEEAKQLVNGQLVEDSAIKSEYNGKVLHIDKRNNNQIEHYDIKDKELRKLLARPMSKMSLNKRLKRDYKRTRRLKHKRSGKHKHKRSGKHKHKRSGKR